MREPPPDDAAFAAELDSRIGTERNELGLRASGVLVARVVMSAFASAPPSPDEVANALAILGNGAVRMRRYNRDDATGAMGPASDVLSLPMGYSFPPSTFTPSAMAQAITGVFPLPAVCSDANFLVSLQPPPADDAAAAKARAVRRLKEAERDGYHFRSLARTVIAGNLDRRGHSALRVTLSLDDVAGAITSVNAEIDPATLAKMIDHSGAGDR